MATLGTTPMPLEEATVFTLRSVSLLLLGALVIVVYAGVSVLVALQVTVSVAVPVASAYYLSRAILAQREVVRSRR